MKNSTKALGAVGVVAFAGALYLTSTDEGAEVPTPAPTEQIDGGSKVVAESRTGVDAKAKAAIGGEPPPEEFEKARSIVDKFGEFLKANPDPPIEKVKEFFEQHDMEKVKPFLEKLMKEGNKTAFKIAREFVYMRIKKGDPNEFCCTMDEYKQYLKDEFGVEGYQVDALDISGMIAWNIEKSELTESGLEVDLRMRTRANLFAGLYSKFNEAGKDGGAMLDLFLRSMNWTPGELLNQLKEVDMYYYIQGIAPSPLNEDQVVQGFMKVVVERYEMPIPGQ